MDEEEEEEVLRGEESWSTGLRNQLPKVLTSSDMDLLHELVGMATVTTTLPFYGIPTACDNNDEDETFFLRNRDYLPENQYNYFPVPVEAGGEGGGGGGGPEVIPEPTPSTSQVSIPLQQEQQLQNQQQQNLEEGDVNVVDDDDDNDDVDEDELESLLLEQAEVKLLHNRERKQLVSKFDREVLDLKKRENRTFARIAEKLHTAIIYKIDKVSYFPFVLKNFLSNFTITGRRSSGENGITYPGCLQDV